MKKIVLLITLVCLIPLFATSDTTYNALTKGQADSLYCSLESGCSGDGGDFNLYLNHSIKTEVNLSLVSSDFLTYDQHVVSGKVFIFGGNHD